MRRITACFLTAGMMLSLCACGGMQQAEEPARRQIFAMDTVMMVDAYGPNGEAAVEETEQAIYQMEALLSRTQEQSQVAALNRSAGEVVELDPQLQELIQAASRYSRETGGAFDITIAPVADAWGFTTDTHQVPEPEVLTELLGHVGMEHVHLEGTAGTVDAGTEIDLGGIAKGYASDQVAQIYTAHEIPQGMVYLGGNVLVWGRRPDGELWRVGIQDPADPENPDAFVGILQLEDAFAITSGGYQRFFEENGTRYHHIIDPSTGYPAESGLLSVTVVAPVEEGRGAMCDALSTALFVLGEEGALDLWRQRTEEFQLVLLTEDGRAVVTDGLAEAFALQEESGYAQEIVS